MNLFAWLAADEIRAARMEGYRDGMRAVAFSLRQRARQELPGREKERDVLRAAADAVEDACREAGR